MLIVILQLALEDIQESQRGKLYGIHEYNKKLEKQNHKCIICGKSEKENGKMLAVDHNHLTLEIRDLLCNNCNIAIGFINEDISIANNIIKYLEKHNGLS